MTLRKHVAGFAVAVNLLLLSSTAVFAAGDKSAEEFVEKAANSNLFEISSSRLALKKSNNDVIKTFAQQMIDDHTTLSDQLKSTLEAANMNIVPPTVLDEKHQKKLDKLDEESGKGFDKRYIEAQDDGHKESIKLFKEYAKKGDNSSLKDFAAQSLPILEQHEDRLKQMKKEYDGKGHR